MGIFCGKRCQDRKDARIQARTERVAIKADARKTAYENGIDPNASMWGAIGAVGSAAAQQIRPGFGNVVQPQPGFFGGPADGTAGMSPAMIAGIVAIGAILLLKK
jgi:hypothetical protein